MRAVMRSWRQRFTVGVGAGALILTGLVAVPPAHAADPCASGNPVVCENSKPGNPPSEWDLSNGNSGDDSIQGFATSISTVPGGTIGFKIKAETNAPYNINIYRLGYYQGNGARRQAPTITVSSPKSQPACITDPSTNNFDCGNWSQSAQWTVPSTAVSGIYIATLNQGNAWSQITFIVRNDSSHSDVIFKTSDATWQAYNTYGGSDFYVSPNPLGTSQARAYKISYNRPFATRGWENGRDFLFSNEYPTLRFLERNGVDVSYTTDTDVSTGTTTLTNHKVFMSVGHDEYWTLPERQHVEAARDAGVNMMFLSGNEVYWHTRLAPSIDGTSTPNRTLVCYKDSWEPAKIDPDPEGSSTWRDPSQAYPNGSNPENSLTGTIYMSNFTDLAITVSAAEGKTRLWRGTSLASLPAGGSATLAPHTVGYESDEDLDNGARPAGLMRLSTTTGPTPQLVQNAAGTQVAPGTTTHSVTLYRAASGALVFGAGTVQWGWALDQYHDGDNSNPPDSRIQQATLNMLADMGVLPTTLMSGLVMPAKSTDTQAPTVSISAPAAGATLQNGSQVTVTGSASDTGGGVVTSVEVSLDGGTTYHRATGTTSWSYTGVVHGVGASSIKVRATDDSANLSSPVSV
ncbi:N,N-dimethylformamidase beta subunit family domain-containing protein, partial [Intrasporangium sp.]|uniref:N,N-dimethylformamidase beta subunit family domain-containing protein n=1 Tax=Intrasporangium sp. TaxID=1925024 RepID=UPI003221C7BD